MVIVVQLCAINGFSKGAELDQATQFLPFLFCDADLCLALQRCVETMNGCPFIEMDDQVFDG